MTAVLVVIPAHASVMRRYHWLRAAMILELERRSFETSATVIETSVGRSGKYLCQETSKFRRRKSVEDRIDSGVDRDDEDNHPNTHLI